MAATAIDLEKNEIIIDFSKVEWGSKPTVDLSKKIEAYYDEHAVDLENEITRNNNNIVALQKITDVVDDLKEKTSIKNGVNKLLVEMTGIYEQKHFGRLGMVPWQLIFINPDIQRLVEEAHIASTIIPRFDPRITTPIDVTYYPSGAPHPITKEPLQEDMYTVHDGFQTCAAIIILLKNNLIDEPDKFEIKANIIDYDLKVPGSNINGEALACLAFRTLNGKGKKEIGEYYLFRSERNSAKHYGSTLREDVHSSELWDILDDNSIIPVNKEPAKLRKQPRRFSHISGMKGRTKWDKPDFTTKAFESTIKFLSKNFPRDLGLHGALFMALDEFYTLLYTMTNGEAGFEEDQFATFLLEEYGSSHVWAEYAKQRLYNKQESQFAKKSWNDMCGVPYLVDAYIEWCKKKNLNPGVLPYRKDFVNYI
jgi:hypothetical protein